MIQHSTVEQILLRTDIRSVVGEYAALQGNGVRQRCCCPFHNEKTPSFFINTVTNRWHCFGACGEGGDVISFVMKKNGMTFQQAVRHLANRCGVTIEECADNHTQEQRETELKREALFVLYNSVQQYYEHQLLLPTAEACQALEYAHNRWGKDLCAEQGIGYAPNSWQGLIDYARQQSLSIELMKEVGLIAVSDKTGKEYDFFRGRIMIPIRDQYGRVIGYTGRTLSEDDKTPKYLNSTSSPLYQKSKTIFGMDIAWRIGMKEGMFVLVEGAPDVLRLQSIGVLNAVASLGSDWTDDQFTLLNRSASKVLFLPDADRPKVGTPYGTGISKVIKSACRAWELGFEVAIKEIPLGQNGNKQDPDSYCKSRLIYDDLETQDFPIWYANKLLQMQDISPNTVVEKVAALLAHLERDHEIDRYINLLNEVIKGKSMWNKAIREAKRKRSEENLKHDAKNTLYLDLFEKYGFQAKGHSYISIGQNGKTIKWSNFTMKPLFHISDGGSSALRLFEIENEDGDKRLIEFKSEDLVSLSRFKQKIESVGNYIWLAKEEQLTRLKQFLYKATETAEPITQLGWQERGFFAFGNGVFDGKRWQETDEQGIVRLGETGNYYLPAFSSVYKCQKSLFQFERSFVHHNWGSISLKQYTTLLIDVFGDNAKIGMAFLMATLFRDIIVAHTKAFPILNIFGPKGSGKSELGHSLMSFFIIENTPPNIQTSTLPALADAVAQCANALVHIDEFKNTIDIDKREFLKGLWDGAGRNRMNMDKDKKREVTRVDSGVILSGQEMATADIALFSRFIFLRYNKSEFSPEAKKKFDHLTDIRKLGCSHLTLQLLQHRSYFEGNFKGAYIRATRDIQDALGDTIIEDRILKNWITPVAAFACLQDRLDMPFTYQNLLSISIKGLLTQNSELKNNNEISTFWDIVNYLRQEGQVVVEADYRLQWEEKLKVDNCNYVQEFSAPKQILYLRYKRIFELYQIHGKKVGESLLPKSSLAYYMENSPAYLGKKRSFRFRNIIQGYTMTGMVRGSDGLERSKTESILDQCYCFDYEKIVELFGVNLGIEYED